MHRSRGIASSLALVTLVGCAPSETVSEINPFSIATRINKVHLELVAHCMRQAGHEYFAEPALSEPVNLLLPYGDHAQQAQEIGTGVTAAKIAILEGLPDKTLAERKQSSRNEKYRGALNSLQLAAFDSTLSVCKNRTVGLLSPVRVELGKIGDLTPVGKPGTGAGSPKMVAFSACMKQKGFTYATKMEVLLDVQQRVDSVGRDIDKLRNEVLPYDREVGKASFECYKSTDSGGSPIPVEDAKALLLQIETINSTASELLDEIVAKNLPS